MTVPPLLPKRSSSRRRMGARWLASLPLVALLAGCSVSDTLSDLDVFGLLENEPPPTETAGQQTVRERGEQASAAAKDAETPKLSSVPDRPAAPTPANVRQQVVDGLVADLENARYTDEMIRLQGGSRETATPVPAPPPAQRAPQAQPTGETPPAQPAARAPQTASAPPRAAESPTRISPTPRTEMQLPPRPEVPETDLPKTRPDVLVDPSAITGAPGLPSSTSLQATDEQVATIHFAHSSSRLDARDRRILAEVASAQQRTGAEVIVVGHASRRTQQLDKVEHELANFRVSLARANNVAGELVKLGVAADRVKIEAVSDTQPMYSESMPTGEAGNRRTDIYFRR